MAFFKIAKMTHYCFNDGMTKTPRSGLKLVFKAKLENWAVGMDYCAVSVPEKITLALGTKGPVLVMAKVNDSTPFKVSLFPVGEGKHFIRIKAKVRKEINVKTGDLVKLQITVLDPADVDYPQDLLLALKSEGVMKDFKLIPPGEQNFILRRIEEAVKPETRKKRIEEALKAANHRREKCADRKK